MKILALDLGDVHTGTALSDSLRMFAKPFKTIPTTSLEQFIKEIIEKENLKIIVLGYPRTMKGAISAQTQKIIDAKSEYEKKFPDISWVLWDERLTSKNAQKFKKGNDKEDKLKLHSVAAALILETYLDFLRLQQVEE